MKLIDFLIGVFLVLGMIATAFLAEAVLGGLMNGGQ
jgi:hypothetical protein